MKPCFGSATAEMLIANMDFAGVNCAVVTQEYIDGCQDDYLKDVAKRFAGRIKVCSLYLDYEPDFQVSTEGFDGIKICASRLGDKDLTRHIKAFEVQLTLKREAPSALCFRKLRIPFLSLKLQSDISEWPAEESG